MTEKKIIKEIGWNFDNSFASLPNKLLARVTPIPVSSPKLVIINDRLAKSLGLNLQALESTDGIEVLAGNKIPEDALPLAQAYAGHQFGHFTMLGDGRAMLLGEQITPLGERFDIQLKGSGRTPYSRGGDGRATLGPMLREYIISESMHGLGIATTRSLAIVKTGEKVIRETELPGAILTRVASSHLRVGTFEFLYKWGSIEDLQALATYTIQRHFPEVNHEENPYLSLLQKVIKRQAELIGFIHGVMNTDNMALSGETIDYGPCAFMDTYNPEIVFSSIDIYGRYAYSNQPGIAEWNLMRFAETLLPLLDKNEDQAVKLAQEAISNFSNLYNSNWLKGMRSKLGIFNEESDDKALIEDLLKIMEQHGADYTNTFRDLTLDKISESDNDMYGSKEFSQWYESWQARLGRQKETKTSYHELMKNNNPSIIPRNHRVEEALEAAVKKEDYCVMERLLNVLSNPYSYSIDQEDYNTLPPPTNRPYKTYCGT